MSQNGRVAGEVGVYRVSSLIAVVTVATGDIHLVFTGDDGSTLIRRGARAVLERWRPRPPRDQQGAHRRPGRQTEEKVIAAGVAFFDFAHADGARRQLHRATPTALSS